MMAWPTVMFLRSGAGMVSLMTSTIVSPILPSEVRVRIPDIHLRAEHRIDSGIVLLERYLVLAL